MGVRSSIKRDDTTLKKVLTNLALLADNHIEYGILEPIEYKNGATVAYIASLAETGFTLQLHVGEVEVPARPFFSQSMVGAIALFKRETSDIVRWAFGAVNKADLVAAINTLGVELVFNVKLTIDNGNFTPNSQYTLMRKLGDSPLKDTHLMYNSITYQVVNSPLPVQYQL